MILKGIFLLVCLANFSSALKSKGTQFLVAFLDNDSEFWRGIPVEILAINDGVNSATVSLSSPRNPALVASTCTPETSFTLAAGQQRAFKVCWWARITDSDPSVNNKVLRVDSTGEITVVGVNKEPYSADSFLVFPIDQLGTSYLPVLPAFAARPNQVVVVASRDNTVIQISLPSAANDVSSITINQRCLSYNRGDEFSVQLQANQAYYVSSLADLTGIQIISSDPIAVFSGNLRTGIPSGLPSRDHLVEQAISVGNWDSQYVYTPLSETTPRGDNVRVLSASDNNSIFWRSANGTQGSFSLNEGDWAEVFLTDLTYIYCSIGSRFAVAVITLSQATPSDSTPTDPALLMLPGLNQMTSNKRQLPSLTSGVSLHLSNGANAESYANNFVIITTLSSDLSGMRLNNQQLGGSCQQVPGQGGYQTCRVSVFGGQINTFSQINGRPFSALQYSTSDRESIAHVLDIQATQQCEYTVMKRGDGKDNDCDGKIDEEVFDNIDNDGDGNVDEDCLTSTGTSVGRTYVIAFTDNSKADSQPNDLDVLEIYISPQSTVGSTRVNVTSGDNSFRTSVLAAAQQTTKIDIPKQLRLPPLTGTFPNALLIQADADIIVYALNKILFSSDAYLALPIDVNGYDYYVVTTQVNDTNDVAEFAVCATEPGPTNLVITLTAPSTGNIYQAGQTPETLSQYQCLQVQSLGDLTGSRVESINQKRVAVFSGNRRPIIGPGSSRDHIVEQLPPVTAWGREFYTAPVIRGGTSGRTRGDILKIVASRSGTTVQIESNGVASGSYSITNAGGFLQISANSDEYTRIFSNNPILVVQLTKTQLNPDASVDQGDPSMSLVVPKEAWTNEYRFVTPRSGQPDPSQPGEYLPYLSRMNLVIEKQHITKLRYGNINTQFSSRYPNAIWSDIAGSSPLVSATSVSIDYGQSYITTTDGTSFYATLYGAADREFYANPISLKLSQSTCQPSSTPQAGVDDDCDGVVDEEVLNGQDDDGDGFVDEDTAVLPTGANGRYILTFMEHVVEYPQDFPLSIYVASRCSGDTSVRFRTINAVSLPSCDVAVKLPAAGVQHFVLPAVYRLEGNGLYNRTIVIESSCEVDVVGYNMDTYSNDGFLVFPASTLGTEYRAVSYYPTTLGAVISVIPTSSASVTVRLPVHGNNPSSNPIVQHPRTRQNFTAGQTFSVQMAQYESLQLTSSGDLSGTVITSDGAPLAVFSGNNRVGILAASRDHIVEQLPPWSKASNEWIVVANGMTSSEFVKAVCDVGTTIAFPSNNDGFPDTTFVISTSGQVVTYEISRSYAKRVTASNGRCQLWLITRSQATRTDPLLGDPSLSLIVPVSQYITSARFTLPNKQSRWNGDEYQGTLVIVVRQDQTNLIRLNGNGVTGWSAVGGSSYSVARVRVSKISGSRTNVVESINGARFEARLWGVADRESFSYTLGVNLQ